MENENGNNNHYMVTRSKKDTEEKIDTKPEDNYKLEIDENGNVSDLIDYECNETFDNNMLQDELNRLRGNNKHRNVNESPKFTISPKKKKII